MAQIRACFSSHTSKSQKKMSSSSDKGAQFDPSDHPHRRFNPLTRSFVLCSRECKLSVNIRFKDWFGPRKAHRTKRPWQGAQESPQAINLPAYDEKCYLCPGNARSSGDARNEKYSSTFVSELQPNIAIVCWCVVIPDIRERLCRSQAGTGSSNRRGQRWVMLFHMLLTTLLTFNNRGQHTSSSSLISRTRTMLRHLLSPLTQSHNSTT